MVLVVLTIFLFLGSVRATLIPAVTVPVSLIATFIVLMALGFSINILTLLALVLAIGLVVDDAIVVLENVHRRSRISVRVAPPISAQDSLLLAKRRSSNRIGSSWARNPMALV